MSNTFTPIPNQSLPIQRDVNFYNRKLKTRVFLNFAETLAIFKSSHMIILEIGFNHALDFLLCWQHWLERCDDKTLHFFMLAECFPSFEAFARYRQLYPELALLINQLLQVYPVLTPGFHELVLADGCVRLTLILGEISASLDAFICCGDSVLEQKVKTHFASLIYLNQHQKNNNFLTQIKMLSQSKALIHAPLMALDASYELLQLPFDNTTWLMNQASMAPYHLKRRATPWHLPEAPTDVSKDIVIIGAGLAGCTLAHFLALRGFNITLIDEHKSVAGGASGIKQAVLYPKLSAHQSNFSQLMLESYLFATKFYQQILAHHQVGELNGMLELTQNKPSQSLQNWFEAYPQLGKYMNAEAASKKAGIMLDKSGIYFPDSGWINVPKLCRYLIKHPGITVLNHQPIQQLVYLNGHWHVNHLKVSKVVIACGHTTHLFEPTAFLPIQQVSGSVSYVRSSNGLQNLNIPLCGQGHLLPKCAHMHLVGATYHPVEKCQDIYAHHHENLSKLSHLTGITLANKAVQNIWTGVRAVTPDYLPYVGPVPKAELFKVQFKAWSKDKNRWLDTLTSYHPGLFAMAGFGSRGLTTIPYMAEFLASFINNEPLKLSQNLIKAVSLARVLRKKIIQDKF
ncbi:MAG TPA: hypothetical protein DCG13_03855 [Legionellales bacterium]|nr:hypothetical protein [Legionellales bacterium]HCA89677.1 hypothetical protein [Legionellales bacterium]|tara:strand:- start:1233 stop:3113 length:1881 start_codon:yes stop_codon:yes gene_type:complete